MELYVTDENCVKRKVKAIWKGSADGTPVKLEEGTPAYFEALIEAARQGVVCFGT